MNGACSMSTSMALRYLYQSSITRGRVVKMVALWSIAFPADLGFKSYATEATVKSRTCTAHRVTAFMRNSFNVVDTSNFINGEEVQRNAVCASSATTSCAPPIRREEIRHLRLTKRAPAVSDNHGTMETEWLRSVDRYTNMRWSLVLQIA
jgi:hypothetical protein